MYRYISFSLASPALVGDYKTSTSFLLIFHFLFLFFLVFFFAATEINYAFALNL